MLQEISKSVVQLIREEVSDVIDWCFIGESVDFGGHDFLEKFDRELKDWLMISYILLCDVSLFFLVVLPKYVCIV